MNESVNVVKLFAIFEDPVTNKNNYKLIIFHDSFFKLDKAVSERKLQLIFF